ncbi:MAG: hypothetical protein ACOVSS_01790, partial [Bacteroidia bacterium]
EDLDAFTAAYETQGGTLPEQRRQLAGTALQVTSAYDAMIAAWLAGDTPVSDDRYPLRYGENPHQAAWFQGDLKGLFHQHHGKELSYNNLLDADAAVMLMADFQEKEEAVFAILKHNNACGFAMADTLPQAWHKALAADPVSAFGGVLICNRSLDLATAEAVNQLFFEILIAPGYEAAALELLKSKKNRMLLEQRQVRFPQMQRRSVLNGVLWQQRDTATEDRSDFQFVTTRKPSDMQCRDLECALRLAKTAACLQPAQDRRAGLTPWSKRLPRPAGSDSICRMPAWPAMLSSRSPTVSKLLQRPVSLPLRNPADRSKISSASMQQRL